MSRMRSDSLEGETYPYSWAFTDKAFVRHSQCQVPNSAKVGSEVSRWNPDITNLTNLDRQNFVLNWIQTTLGVSLQQFLSANTSTARNKRTVVHDENLAINRAAPMGKEGYTSISNSIKDPIAMSVSSPTYLRSLSIPSSSARRSRTPTLHEQFWDQWYNGALLSEIVAALLIDMKNLIKEVEFFDNYGRIIVPKKLLLVGTVHVVKSTAQMLNNMEICLKAIADHLPLVAPLKFFAQDIVYGPPDILWSVLYTLYKAYGGTNKKNSGCAPSSSSRTGMGRGTNSRGDFTIRGRTLHSGSSSSGGHSGAATGAAAPRSSSAPPPSSRHGTERSHTKDHRQAHVHFSSSTKGSTAVKGAQGLHQTHNRPSTPGKSEPSAGSGSHGVKSDLMKSFAELPKRSSRSLSPVSISRASTTSNSNTSTRGSGGGSSVVSAPSQYEQMTQLVEARQNEKMRDRLRARAIDRRKRKTVIDELDGCQPSPVVPPVNPLMQDQFNAVDKTKQPSTLETGGKKVIRQGWYPPPMTAIELERVRLITPPIVTPLQQAQIKTWLTSLQIYLLEGEGGFYSRVNHTTAEIPPPLPLVDDRLRNGVLLCGLAVLLERHAAGHVNLAALTHMRPTTLRMAVENLDRALWLFKMRRSPPIPLVFLSQPEEIIKCHKNLLWGLLFELMQAYPHGDTRSDDPRTSMGSIQPRGFDVESLDEEQDQRGSLPWPQTAGRVKYNAKRRREVDVMLMSWLSSSGVLRQLYGSEYSLPVSVMALEAFVKDGSLLKNIVTHILEIKVQCHAKPATFELCLSNTRKCVNTLRRLGGRMNDRYLYVGVEEQLLRGDWDCILGLLEDVKQYADSIVKTPPVSVFHTQKALEMKFENHHQQHQRQAKHKEVRLDSLDAVVDYSPEDFLLSNLCEFESEPSPTTGTTVDSGSNSSGNNNNNSKVRLSFEGVASRDSAPYHWGMGMGDEQGGRYHDLIPSRHVPNLFDETLRQQPPQQQQQQQQQQPFNHPFGGEPAAAGSISLPGPPSVSRAVDEEGESPASTVPTPQPAPKLPTSGGRGKKKASLEDSDNEDEEEEQEEGDSLEHPSISRRNKRIVQWTKKLGVEVSPEVDFSDGVVLHSILMKLVRGNALPGFIASPRSNAHKIQNIRKSLEYLASHQKRIPLFALSCEEDIFHNNFEAVCDLLRAIRKGYSIHQV